MSGHPIAYFLGGPMDKQRLEFANLRPYQEFTPLGKISLSESGYTTFIPKDSPRKEKYRLEQYPTPNGVVNFYVYENLGMDAIQTLLSHYFDFAISQDGKP